MGTVRQVRCDRLPAWLTLTPEGSHSAPRKRTLSHREIRQRKAWSVGPWIICNLALDEAAEPGPGTRVAFRLGPTAGGLELPVAYLTADLPD
jgi:hypothetical protein